MDKLSNLVYILMLHTHLSSSSCSGRLGLRRVIPLLLLLMLLMLPLHLVAAKEVILVVGVELAHGPGVPGAVPHRPGIRHQAGEVRRSGRLRLRPE